MRFERDSGIEPSLEYLIDIIWPRIKIMDLYGDIFRTRIIFKNKQQQKFEQLTLNEFRMEKKFKLTTRKK
jgi:hypothetical protein